MLKQMEASNATFSLVWIALDLTRKKGGKIMVHEGLQLKRNSVRKKGKPGNRPSSPRHSETFNLYDPDMKRYFKVYKRLIVGFNSKNVVY